MSKAASPIETAKPELGVDPALAEFETGLVLAGHAFARWLVRAMSGAGFPDLSPTDVMVLHCVDHPDRRKRQADIRLALNIEDTHLVAYAIKRLERLGLVASAIVAKEKQVTITEKGEEACRAYREIRRTLLVQSVKAIGFEEGRLMKLGARLRALSGHYEQAARAAARL
ncbi:MAG TPA: winged helix DNA-binding protein [Roseiarcus sp.]|nr:winged helix DNA-binding protein [Roseiarcus sp.]